MDKPESFDVGQIVGLIVALSAVLYTVASTLYDIFIRKTPKKRSSVLKEHFPVEDRMEDEEDLEDQEDLEDKEELPPPPPEVMVTTKHKKTEFEWAPQSFSFESSLEGYRQKSDIEDRKLDVKFRIGDDLVSSSLKRFASDEYLQKTNKKKQIVELVKALPSKRTLIIASEILRPPLSLRRDIYR